MSKVNQPQSINVMKSGVNCFLTGAGGTGKSYVIRQLMDWFDEKEINYMITASTGIAAQLINGVTIHSYSGIGIKTDLNEIINSKNFKRYVAPKLRKLEVLIIDEISMLGALTLSILDHVMRKANNNDKSFGGCQVIIVGDPFQLPPVNDSYFFVCDTYWDAEFKILNLTRNYRALDPEWIELLRKIRVGVIDDSVYDMFYRRSSVKPPKDILRFVATNKEADYINENKLSLLNTDSRVFKFSVSDKYEILGEFGTPEYNNAINKFFKYRPLKREIEIKIGARVMIIVNDTREHRYVNGTCGIVVDMDVDGIVVETQRFKLDDKGNKVLDENNRVIMEPDDRIRIDAKHWFKIEKKISNPNYGGTYLDDRDREMYDDRDHIIAEANIGMLPVILAWATTTHKSQGQTVDTARIRLINGFAEGQSYVALSRVKTEDGVFLEGMPSEASLQVNADVVEFVKMNIKEFTEELDEGM